MKEVTNMVEIEKLEFDENGVIKKVQNNIGYILRGRIAYGILCLHRKKYVTANRYCKYYLCAFQKSFYKRVRARCRFLRKLLKRQ